MTALLIVILAQPTGHMFCTETAPIQAQEIAPCTGLLWSPDASRAAVGCARVDLPKCKADAVLFRSVCSAERGAFKIRAVTAEALLKTVEPPPPRWVLPVVSGGAFVVGIIVGVFAAGMF